MMGKAVKPSRHSGSICLLTLTICCLICVQLAMHSASKLLHCQASTHELLGTSNIDLQQRSTAAPRVLQSVDSSLSTFKTQGWHQVTQYQPRRNKFNKIAVLGERNSGTNFVENLLKSNLNNIPVQFSLTTKKHYMQPYPPHHNIHQFDNVLTILVVRNVYDWLQSMHTRCYCCSSIDVNTLSFNNFLTAPYPTMLEADPTNPKDCPADYNIYSPVKEYRDIFDIRYKKLMHFLNVSTWVGGFDIVRWEDLLSEEQQVEWVRGFSDKWGLNIPKDVVPLEVDPRGWVAGQEKKAFCVECRVAGSMYLNSTLTVDDAEKKEMCVGINSKVVPALEGLLGYHVIDCDGGGYSS